jgi:hypothetical protein
MHLSVSIAAIGLVALVAQNSAAAADRRVPVTPPQNVVTDPSLATFRGKLDTIAKARDLNAMKGLLGPSFFWERDFGGGYDANASPMQNLTVALSLDDAELEPEYKGSGWRRLRAIVASEMFVAGKHGNDAEGSVTVKATCGPTAPTYDESAIDDVLIWGYVLGRTDAYAKPSAASAKIGRLENEAVEVIEPASEELGHAEFAKVKLPTGKPGWVPSAAIRSFVEEQLCFQKLNGSWKIVGYIGGGD